MSASSGFGQGADNDQRANAAGLYKLATEVRELDRCMSVISVEDLANFEPLRTAYFRKVDELSKAVEDHVTKFAGRKGKYETVPAFRYRLWESTLRAGFERARPSTALNHAICSGLSVAR